MISLSGKVIHGKGLGHQYGMPTANIDVDTKGLKKGVYAGYATIDKKQYLCVTNIGLRPTVDNDNQSSVESYLIDFIGDIYNQDIKLELIYYLRETQKFNNLMEVKKQVELDIKQAKKLLLK